MGIGPIKQIEPMPSVVLNTAIFSLIRTPNLFIVALVQSLVYGKILLPSFEQHGISPQLDPLRFSIFVGVTLCITAGGYIINDIIDVPMDLINRPTQVIVGRRIAEQTVSWLYYCFNLIGFTAALYLAFYVQQLYLVSLFPLAGMGLFLYSYKLKRQPLTGNLLVSAYCAAVAGVVWFAEREAYYQLSIAYPSIHQTLTGLLIWYLVLAFLATLFRELIKDLQDQSGDQASGAQTLPLWAGARKAKIAAFISGATIAIATGLMCIQLHSLFYDWSLALFLSAVLLPLGVALTRLIRAKSPDDFRRLSNMAKWIILVGLLLPVFVHY